MSTYMHCTGVAVSSTQRLRSAHSVPSRKRGYSPHLTPQLRRGHTRWRQCHSPHCTEGRCWSTEGESPLVSLVVGWTPLAVRSVAPCGGGCLLPSSCRVLRMPPVEDGGCVCVSV